MLNYFNKRLNNKSKLNELDYKDKYTIDDIEAIKQDIKKLYEVKENGKKVSKLTKKELKHLLTLAKEIKDQENKLDNKAENIIEIFFTTIVIVILFDITQLDTVIGFFVIMIPTVLIYVVYTGWMNHRFSIKNYNLIYLVMALEDLLDDKKQKTNGKQ